MKFTKEDLIKALDQAVEELDLVETKDETVVKAEEGKPEVTKVEKAKKASEPEDEDEDEEEEMDEEKVVPKKKVVKKAEVENKDESLTKAFTEQGETLKKALDMIGSLQKAVENLKTVPTVKKSVDGLEVIQKGNESETHAEEDATADTIKKALGKLTKSQVADIMYTDLLEKGVSGVSARDICEYEATGYISNKDVLEKTLGAVNTRIKNGLL